jgi:hypothetical protein
VRRASAVLQAEGVQQAAHHEVEIVHQAMARKSERDWLGKSDIHQLIWIICHMLFICTNIIYCIYIY